MHERPKKEKEYTCTVVGIKGLRAWGSTNRKRQCAQTIEAITLNLMINVQNNKIIYVKQI